MSEIQDIVTALNTKSTEIKNAQDKIAQEVKEFGESTVETKAALEQSQKEFGELKDLFGKMDEALKEMQKKAHRYDEQNPITKSMGQLVIESVQFKNASESGAHSMQAVTLDRKDISGLAASAGALVRPDRDPTVYQNPTRPTRIRDLIPSVSTSSNAVEYMRENVFTNNAAPQGTSAGIGAGELQTKAKSEITYELITKPVSTIAHHVIASRQVLSDAPMLQGLINGRLTYGLDLESDDQLLLGDGTGQNLTGIMVDTDINDVGELPSGTAAADVPSAMIDHIRKAITQCQLMEYYNINGLVVNPQDWEILETAKATDGHYLMVSMPTTTSEMRLWRVPVVVTNAMPVNNFLLGDWSMGAVLYDRESVTVRVSESHSNLFIENGVVILGEERYTLGIPLPKAFCKGQFTVAS
jgi:HK97 family phage major capsid protein